MQLSEIINSNYAAITIRCKVTSKTTIDDFMSKIMEEYIELNNASIECKGDELADVILVCLNFAKHFNIDIEKVMIDKIKYNENRKDWL